MPRNESEMLTDKRIEQLLAMLERLLAQPTAPPPAIHIHIDGVSLQDATEGMNPRKPHKADRETDGWVVGAEPPRPYVS